MAEQLIRLHTKGITFHGVIAADDSLALGVMKYGREMKLRIPEDLSIIGYNNSMLVNCCDPELTSIDNKLETLCQHLITTLMGVLGGNEMVLTKEEELKFKTAFMLFVGREYHKLDWAMQLHYGCKRDNNTLMFEKLGPDTGYDCINNYAPSAQMADFLNALIVSDELPRTVIYSLNPNDNQAIGTILGCFQDSTAVAKIQQGSAWWFNDHKTGMQDQMISLANLGNLSGFVGMLTDSRSFLSYTRHEYFRRILCNLIGNWVESGEFPADYDTLSEIVTDISYNNAKRYFKFPLA
jgi:glucuronate isomerase